MRYLLSCLLTLMLMGSAIAQAQHPQNNPPPRSPNEPYSSSKSTRIDLAPPKNDARDHPNSTASLPGDVNEMYTYDPHRAAKDVEVGDFYYNRKNYRAAVSRYRSALRWKPNDAFATFKLAMALEKAGDFDEARRDYQAYLKILPEGDKAEDAKKALERLPKEENKWRKHEEKEAEKHK